MRYNAKFIDYGDEVQIRLYNKTLNTSRRNLKECEIECRERLYNSYKSYLEKMIKDPVNGWVYQLELDDLEVEYADFKNSIADNDNNKLCNPSSDDISSDEDKRLRCLYISCNRSKDIIYQYANSNVWDWFVTFTLSAEKAIDRFDFDSCLKQLRKWLNHVKERYAPDLMYVIVPEKHKNGAWHFHGLLGNTGKLTFEESGYYLYKKRKFNALRLKPDSVVLEKGSKEYYLKQYHLGKIQSCCRVYDSHGVSGYITKYITKELIFDSSGKHRFLHSNNLCKPVSSFGSIPAIYKADYIEKLYNDDSVKYDNTIRCDDFGLQVRYMTVKKSDFLKEIMDAT